LQGPASIKLLHQLLDQLSVLRPVSEGHVHQLFDALPPATLRQAFVVIVSTRAINLADEVEQSARLAAAPGRGLAGHILMLDVSRGDLSDLIRFSEGLSPTLETRGRTSGSSETDPEEEPDR
jgi:hypothetical protein